MANLQPNMLMMLATIVATTWGCGPPHSSSPLGSLAPLLDSVEKEKTMKLESRAFDNGSHIDKKYTADGDDISPPLAWSNVPSTTKTLALICDDPDAPSPRKPAAQPWVHWILFNVPNNTTGLPEGIKRKPAPDEVPGARQGTNSWPNDNIGYRGPAPPPGSGRHRYFFKLYALDRELDLKAGAAKRELQQAMEGHVLTEGQLIGTYER